MQGVHTVDEVRAAEDAVLARVAEQELMLRAATGLARTCAELLVLHRGLVYGARVVLLVGTGNNGGDALFAGAVLARRGALVLVVPTGPRMHAAGLAAARRAGGRVLGPDEARTAIDTADLVMDGIVGIGGSGGLREPARSLVDRATSSDALVVSVDVPSGVDADTGVGGDDAVWADVTVTFGLLKAGLLLPPGSSHAGLLELVDIGLADDAVVPSVTCLEASDVATLLPRPGPSDHKYSQGVVGLVAGSRRYPGAAVLASGGAAGVKSGLVRYVGPAAAEVVRAWPSVIVTEGPLADAGRAQAWAVGPGIGTDEDAKARLGEVLALPVPVVVDADAITLVAETPRLLAGRPAPTILTPHEREFARLAPDLDQVADPIAAVRVLAARLGCTVLLKGATTVVADPDGQARLNLTGTPWLASAGTGDVLTGMLAALLAGGLVPLDAAAVAAFVHGVAGRLAADDAPTTASAVAAAIPAAVRTLSRP